MKSMSRKQIDKVEREFIKNLGLGIIVGSLLLLLLKMGD